MKIGIANDHRGVTLKNNIVRYLESKGIEIINYGTDSIEKVDYIDYAIKVCDAINNNELDRGILICGTGLGMCIAANKIKGIICAKVSNAKEAYLTRSHNDANVLALGEDIEDPQEILDEFLNTEFSEVERYHKRKEKLMELEKRI